MTATPASAPPQLQQLNIVGYVDGDPSFVAADGVCPRGHQAIAPVDALERVDSIPPDPDAPRWRCYDGDGSCEWSGTEVMWEQGRAIYEWCVQSLAPTATPRSRPMIDIRGGDLHRKVDEAWRALITANDDLHPRVMVLGNELVRMTERGELEAFTVDSLRDELSRVAEFGRFTSQGDWSPQDPPAEIARTLLARDSAEYGNAPRVERVVDVPVVAVDGSIIMTPGYHAGSRVFFRPANEVADVEPSAIEVVDDVANARDLLVNDLLADFPFADQASRANALGLLLLPFVRDLIDGPTPMHVILAPEPGTGKTLLAHAALLPGCGTVPATPDVVSDDQWRKQITSLLLSGARAILFDNLRRALDTGALAAALTSGEWSDRVLGVSKQVTLPVRNVWVATGNNLELTDEQARRAVPIFLDPGEVRPADRPKADFRHANLLSWAKANRADLVSAALTLVRHWLSGSVVAFVDGGHTFVRDEEREPTRKSLGSFESWAEVIGGILRAADVPGFLENRDRLEAEANLEKRELAGFLRAWYDLGKEPLKSGDLQSLCALGGELHDVVPTELAGARDLEKRLPYWLRKHKNRRANGYQLLAQDDGRVNRWFVRHTRAPSQDGAE